MLTGSCLCKTVRYEISSRLNRFVHCHCHTCRKVHGTVYRSSAVVKAEDFRLVSGADDITAYESSPGKQRCFCRVCGSHVFARFKSGPEIVILRMGTLDTDVRQRPEGHIWVSHKAPWYEILDDLPRFEEGTPS